VCRSGSNAITAPAVTGPSPGTLHKRRISTFSRVASLSPNVGSLIFAVRDRSDRGRAVSLRRRPPCVVVLGVQT
jgi:hypothetical protein